MSELPERECGNQHGEKQSERHPTMIPRGVAARETRRVRVGGVARIDSGAILCDRLLRKTPVVENRRRWSSCNGRPARVEAE